MLASLWRFPGAARSLCRSRPRHARAPNRRPIQLRLEPLEDRWLPSILIVTSTADSGPGTLRNALATVTTGGTIEFALPNPSTIHLSSGSLTVGTAVNILGPGSSALSVAGDGQFSDFVVQATTTISGLTISGGGGTMGGGIVNDSNLTLNNCAITNNSATTDGGGIYSSGALNITNCLISQNSCMSQGGSGATTLQGGAIFVQSGGTLNLTAVFLASNAVTYTGGGSSSVTLEGGAIYNAGIANSFLSTVINNSATFSVTNAVGQGDLQGNNDSGGNAGDNIGNAFIGNVTVEGGGIYNAGSLTFSFGLVSQNSAASIVTNGSLSPPRTGGNGSYNAEGDSGQNDGNTNGNGLIGNITVEGGGLYNAGTTNFQAAVMAKNSASSTVTNGGSNGDNNGQDGHGDNNGDNNGNGVLGNITVAGGGIYNFGGLTVSLASLTRNQANSFVTNGSNNGNNDGVLIDSLDGNDNGNGVVGNITVVGGGIANDPNGASATISTESTLSVNSVTSSIINGSGNGNFDGFSNTGTVEGKDNGNGVAGQMDVGGGAINIATGGRVTLNVATLTDNFVQSGITNGSANGNNDGNNDGNGDGLANVSTVDTELGVRGGAIRNAGVLSVTGAFIFANSATSTVVNGDSNGNNNGDNDSRSEEGRANGNGVSCGNSGRVLVSGGGIANSGSLDLFYSTLSFNSLESAVTNGSNNGQNDGQNDGGNNNCGINCGDGIFGNVEVDGAGVGTSGTAQISDCAVVDNSAASFVSNGSNNGAGSGSGSTGADGQGDGNGVDGNVEVVGGGTANFGKLNFVGTIVAGNSILSNPSSGSGNLALDGVLINGTVTVSGQDTFG